MSFDLNINNYSRDELIEMFDLPSNFDRNIVEIKETKLKDSIFNNKEINKETQLNTINFLTKAKSIILNLNKNEDNSKKSTELIKTDPNLLYDKGYAKYYDLSRSDLDKTSPLEHPLQVRYERPPTSSYPSEYYPGVINPIKKRVTKKNVIIDSRFRDSYYTTSSSNFSITLPTNFNDVIEMQLISIKIPFAYYAISKQYGNNFFSISVQPSGGSLSTTIIVIPDGNYEQFSIINALNNALTIAGSPFNKVAFNIDVGISTAGSQLIGTNKCIIGPIDQTTNPVDLIELNFQADINGNSDLSTQLPLKFGWMLGFRNGLYNGSINYVSEGLVDLSGPKYVYLILDDYNNNVSKNFYGLLNSSILQSNIFAQFPVFSTSPYNIYIESSLTTSSAPPRIYFGPVNLNNMTIQLTDEYGRIINLNNMDFSFTITLTSIYDL
jgi:hypothetical protein